MFKFPDSAKLKMKIIQNNNCETTMAKTDKFQSFDAKPSMAVKIGSDMSNTNALKRENFM